MSERLSIAIVVAVASGVGVVLARVAGAVGPTHPSVPVQTTATVPSAVASASAAPSASAPPPAASAHDDGDLDEAHSPGMGDNPYDDANQAHAPLQRQLVVSQDGMLRLPGARFIMGSANPHAPSNERPPRTVTLATFWIDRTEVTVGAYRGCVQSGSCAAPARTSSACTYEAGDPELPISCVHWRDAESYCRFAGKRLPTEREWEYAARGTFAMPFPWGMQPGCNNAVTLISEQSAKTCTPRPGRVGTHPGGASTFGVQDMSGNVEEWTDDWYVESLGPGPAPRAGAAHVLRGGGWLSPPSASRTTSRNWGSAIEAGPNVGFRCAKDGGVALD